MKKILFFIGTMDDGGAQRVVSIISNELVKRNYDVEILKYYDSENIYHLDKKIKVNSVIFNTKSKNLIINLKWMRNYFKKQDLIISFLAIFNILALLANLNNNVPIIVSDRNDPKRVPSNKIICLVRNILYKKANYIVVQTENNRKYFNSNKCVVIKNPVDLEKYIGKALHTKKEDKIVSVGRLTAQKNQLMLINAFYQFHKKHSNFHLVIYGDDENYKDVLMNRINELKLSDYVELPGSKKNVLDLICDAKCFVLSSNYEGMPNALIEAMCLGLPVISTKVSGADDLIINDYNGLLINVGDENCLIEDMEKVIDKPDKSNQMAKNACDIYNDLSVKKITDEWIDLMNRL